MNVTPTPILGDNAGNTVGATPAPPVLRLGARGEWVKTLQEMLGITADGIFGRQTLAALEHYQATHGLHVTGVTGIYTWNSLGKNAPGHAAPSSGVTTSGGVTASRSTGSAGRASPESYQQFAVDVLQGLGAPTTAANVNFILSWAKREGGGGTNNPLNTTLSYGGATNLAGNPAGVKNYATFQDGVMATIQTLHGSAYSDIRSALASGHANPSASYSGLLTWSGGGYDTLSGVDGSSWAKQTVSGSGGGAGGSGAGGFGPTGPTTVAGAGAGNAEFSKQDLAAELDNLGMPKALIDSDPSLRKVFNQIVQRQLDLSTDAGKARAMQMLKGTKWWKSRSDSQRKWDVMQVDNPGEVQRQLVQKSRDLQALSVNLGIPLNGKDLHALTTLALRNNLDDNEIRKSVAQHFAYNPNGKYTGEVGLDIAQLQQMASNYYVDVSPNTLNSQIDQMLVGGTSPQQMQDYYKQLAESKFPHLKKQLDAGQTVSDIADPYKQEMAKTLEMDPSGIKNEDPSVMKALQQPTGKGDFQLMPLYQFSTMLKQDPRWLKTNNARDSLMDAGIGLLRQMGLVA